MDTPSPDIRRPDLGITIRFVRRWRPSDDSYPVAEHRLVVMDNGRSLLLSYVGRRYYDPLARLLDPAVPWTR